MGYKQKGTFLTDKREYTKFTFSAIRKESSSVYTC